MASGQNAEITTRERENGGRSSRPIERLREFPRKACFASGRVYWTQRKPPPRWGVVRRPLSRRAGGGVGEGFEVIGRGGGYDKSTRGTMTRIEGVLQTYAGCTWL